MTGMGSGSSSDAQIAACTCDPTLDYGPNDAKCPRHGAEVRQWEAWRDGNARCPYCIGVAWEDFVAMCDCWQAERETEALLHG